jgi:hypothetical protein
MMMNKQKVLLLALLTLLILTTLAFRFPSVQAVSAYKTYTLDRGGYLSETNEAYEAIYQIRALSDGSTLNSAKDLFIDDDNFIYIADTGNQRIVILDPNYQVLWTFGSDLLIKPLGIYVLDDLIYVCDYGLGQTKTDLGSIYVWRLDKTKTDVGEALTLVHTFSTPESAILAVDGFIFRPMKIAVDENQTMYVINEGTTSGVLMINSENRFINYFASNTVNIPLWDRIQRILYADNPNVTLRKNIPTPVTNITLDGKGYFYTVTQKGSGDTLNNLKKVNIGGINYFDSDMYSYADLVDVWTGSVENVYVVTSAGFIAEYDNLGNMLFLWGGTGVGNDKLGLFASASAIAVDGRNQIYVLDDNSKRNCIQVFRETRFAAQVHEALGLYNEAKYVESISVWEEVLRYNSMLDMAYRGIGLGYMMSGQYELALKQFDIAYDQEDYSEAFWEIRNLWLQNHITTLLWIVLILGAGLLALRLTNQKTHWLAGVGRGWNRLMQVRTFREVAFMFRFIRHPADTCYEIKAKKRVSMTTAWLILGLLFLLYIAGILWTGFIFNRVIPEETILVKEALSILLPILIFVIANYLMSSLMEGEGTFRATFINSVGTLMPVFILYPIIIALSNVITLNESFLYTMGLSVMFGWVAILVFFNIKETHNYTVGQTIVNLLMTLLMMVILILVLIMVYLMVLQVTDFLTDVIKEVILRE